MRKKWKLFIFRLERDAKVRNDMILLSLSAIMLLAFAGLMIINPQKQQAEKLKEITSESTFVGITNSINRAFPSEVAQSTTMSTTVTSDSAKDIQPAIDEFTGGWKIPEGETFFFINSDGSTSAVGFDGTIISSPLDNLHLYYTEDGKSALSYSENGAPKEWIKQADGTIISEGQVYQPLGDVTIEQYQNGY